MKRPQRGAPRALRDLHLPKGVVLHARVLDPYTSARVDAAVEREIAAIVRGEESPDGRDWLVTEDQAAALLADIGLRNRFADWMRLVILAEICVERVEGFDEEDGPVEPSFDLFAALFEAEAAAEAFRRASVLLTINEVLEKNGSGRGPSGSSAAAPNSAQDAAPETTQHNGTPAPEANLLPITTDNAAAALASNTPLEPMPAQSPGASSAAPGAGSPASAASPA